MRYFKTIVYVASAVSILLYFQNCSQVNFKSQAATDMLKADSFPSCADGSKSAGDTCQEIKMCGTHVELETWRELISGTRAVPRLCPDGTKVDDIWSLDQLFLCNDGVAIPQGDAELKDLLSRGVCPKTPANCGNRLHNELWWEAFESGINRTCPDSSVVEDIYKKERELLCKDGVIMPTGKEQLKELLRAGVCNLRSCGARSHGTVWWIAAGNYTEPVKCPDGSIVEDLYYREEELLRDDGTETKTNKYRKGTLYKKGICPDVKKNCGERKHSEEWKESSGTISEPRVCANGLMTTAIFGQFKKLACDDGNVIFKGYEKGDLISMGNCPFLPCGDKLHGESWWADLGELTSEPKACTYGPGGLKNFYGLLRQQSCDDGKVKTSANTSRGPFKYTTGECNICPPGEVMFQGQCRQPRCLAATPEAEDTKKCQCAGKAKRRRSVTCDSSNWQWSVGNWSNWDYSDCRCPAASRVDRSNGKCVATGNAGDCSRKDQGKLKKDPSFRVEPNDAGACLRCQNEKWVHAGMCYHNDRSELVLIPD